MVIKIIVGSIVMSFAGSISTIAYLILREDVDGTEMYDVYFEEEDGEKADISRVDKAEYKGGGIITTTDTSAKEEVVTEKPVSAPPKESEMEKPVSEEPETTGDSSDNNGSSPEKQE